MRAVEWEMRNWRMLIGFADQDSLALRLRLRLMSRGLNALKLWGGEEGWLSSGRG